MHALALVLALASADTLPVAGPFADAATAALVERAIARRGRQDDAVQDYTARLRYRLTLGVARRRWGRAAPVSVEEQQMALRWQRPNDLQVEVLARRARSTNEDLALSSVFERPWFVPREVDDSVRIFSDDFPAAGALHPLAADGPSAYRYAITDSLAVQVPDGRTLRVAEVEVLPRVRGAALVTGRLWLEQGTAEVVRFSFRYVGTGLWVRPEGASRKDSTSARRVNVLLNRFASIEADLEYGVQAGGVWMPYRQTVAGRVEVPLAGGLTLPFTATTTFSDYELNGGAPIAFRLPPPDTSDAARRARRDSLRAERRDGLAGTHADSGRYDYAGRWARGRYEILRPGNDSLARGGAWVDSLALQDGREAAERLREVEARVARLAGRLPDELSGQRAVSLTGGPGGDLLRYNRVQGAAPGLGVRLRVPGTTFSDVALGARVGSADERLTLRGAFTYDGPSARLSLAGYREVADVDPVSRGHTVANAVSALFVAQDYGDYMLATGASAELDVPAGPGADLTVYARVERQRSVATAARSRVNDFLGGDGRFPANAPVTEGDFATGGVRLRRGGGPLRWQLTGEGIAGAGTANARLLGQLRARVGRHEGLTLRLNAGAALRDTLEQFALRAGGWHTVRGFDYGVQRGQAFWSAQLDVTPFASALRPVVFADAGRAARPGDLVRGEILASAGVGLSLYSRLLGLSVLRVDLSRPVAARALGAGWRLDVVVGAVR